MSRPPTSPCGLCGAPVVWVRLPSGRSMPVNPEPSDDGRVAALLNTAGRLQGLVLGADEQRPAGHRLYVTHFATCEHATRARAIGRAVTAAHQAGAGNVVPFPLPPRRGPSVSRRPRRG